MCTTCKRRNETVQEEVSAIFRGNSPTAQTTPSQSCSPANTLPIFQMRRNYAAAGAKS